MKRAALPLLVVLALAVPVRADAPSDQYQPFAKDVRTIFDKKTHLRWQRFVDPTKTVLAGDFTAGQSYCDQGELPAWGGPGWRLPTVKELLTLVDENPHEEFVGGKSSLRYIDRNAFAGTPTDLSYLTLSDDVSSQWVVEFKTGTASRQNTGAFYVRCVRAEP